MVLGALGDTLTLIGAIGGLLAIVGVGVLILLLASKSREIQAMRDWIEAEPERQQAAQQATIAEVQRRIAQARERRSAQAGGAPKVPGAAPAKPAVPAAAGAGIAAAAIPAGLAKTGDAPAAPTPSTPPPPGASEAASGKPAFAPLTPAGGASDDAAGDEVDEETALSDDPIEPAEADRTIAAPPASVAATSVGRSDTRYDDHDFDLLDEEQPRGGNKLLFGTGIAVLLAGFVLLGVLLLGGGDEQPSGGSSANTEQTPEGGGAEDPEPSTPEGGGEVNPSTVTVRVLNGTQITGLAQRVTDQLTGDGYRSVSPDTYSSDALNEETTVHYREGFKDAAAQIAEDLGLSSSAVQAMDAELRVAATEQADVAVLVGTDLDNGTSPTTG